MAQAPTTLAFPEPLPLRREGRVWFAEVDGRAVKVSNLDKPYWKPEGYTKADLLTYWYNAAPLALPYLRDRPLTLKRMPDGADGPFFYAKQAPVHTPGWVDTAAVVSRDSGKTVNYLLAADRATVVWLANLGCIELHPWHSRIDDIGRPDYAFFDLDPMGSATFAMVRDVALLVKTILDGLGLRGYPRTSGATGMQVYVPTDRVHSAGQIREWVGRACRLINRADPERTTMEWAVERRGGQVFLDHNMNTEGKNIAATYSPRPEREAPVATPLRWDEVATDVEPRDFTIATLWPRVAAVGELFDPVLRGGQDLRAAMAALGMDPDADPGPGAHTVGSPPAATPPRGATPPSAATPPRGAATPTQKSSRGAATPARTSSPPGAQPPRRAKPPPAADPPPPAAERLATYVGKRDFAVTPEPAPPAASGAAADDASGPRFVVQHHLARRLHHDLRLARHGTAPSWALPKGLPDVRGVRHLAVRTEDHPLDYLSFSGEIPAGEYGAGPVRIWDEGTYEALEWTDDKVTFRLAGSRHTGEYHLFRTDRDDPSQWLVTRADADRGDVPPDPPVFEPMLAVDGGEAFDDPDWLFEVKWDGIRAIATTRRPGTGRDAATSLVSRRGNDVTAAYPELAPLWERVLARNAVLDGEVVAFDRHGRPSFQRLQHRMHVRDTAAVARARTAAPVVYVVFDLLAVDGEALVDLPLTDRLARLDDTVVAGGPLLRSTPVAGDGVAMFAAAAGKGLEGLVAKRAASRYFPGRRSRDWRKLKIRRRVDAVIGGWLEGKDGRSGRLGALLVGLYDDSGGLRHVGRVGTGFDDAELDRLAALLAEHARTDSPFTTVPERQGRWVEPVMVCGVEYGDVTDAGKLRHPAYLGLRPDAEPRHCVVADLDPP